MEESLIKFKIFDYNDYEKVVFDNVIDSIVELERIIIKNLSESTFMLEKTKQDYIDIFGKNNCVFACAFDNDKIIGSLITKPSKHSTINLEIKEYDTKLECANCMVHPDYRRHGILKHLLEKVTNYYNHKKALLTAEVVINNYASLFSFLKAGFAIDNAEVCSFDNARLLYLFYVGKDKLNKIINNSNNVGLDDNKIIMSKNNKIKKDVNIEKEFLMYENTIKKDRKSIFIFEDKCNSNENILLSFNLNKSLNELNNLFDSVELNK